MTGPDDPSRPDQPAAEPAEAAPPVFTAGEPHPASPTYPATGWPEAVDTDSGGPAAGPVEPAGAGVVPEASVRGRSIEPAAAAEEAARLAEAAGDWVRRTVPEVVAVLRGERPEVTERLVEAGAAVGAAARALLDALTRPVEPPSPPGPPGEEPEPPPDRRVEPIDVE